MQRTISQLEYKNMKKEGDGLCQLCSAWSYGVAEPMSENVYCDNCDNRAVVGIDKAKALGLIEIIQ